MAKTPGVPHAIGCFFIKGFYFLFSFGVSPLCFFNNFERWFLSLNSNSWAILQVACYYNAGKFRPISIDKQAGNLGRMFRSVV